MVVALGLPIRSARHSLSAGFRAIAEEGHTVGRLPAIHSGRVQPIGSVRFELVEPASSTACTTCVTRLERARMFVRIWPLTGH